MGTWNDRPSEVAPVRVDEIDGHRGTDIDDADGTTWRQMVSADRADKTIDSEPPRLRIR
jgi:hypothetical protein